MKWFVTVALIALSAGCASSGGGGAEQQNNFDADASAKIHTELAALYYGQQRYGVALEELKYALHINKK